MDRVLWIIAIGASAMMSVYSIYNVWSNWKRNPIIVDKSPTLNFINEIPFPAVSICPYTLFASNKFNYTAVHRLVHKLDGPNSRDLTTTEYVFL